MGPVGEPILVTSWTGCTSTFEEFTPDSYAEPAPRRPTVLYLRSFQVDNRGGFPMASLAGHPLLRTGPVVDGVDRGIVGDVPLDELFRGEHHDLAGTLSHDPGAGFCDD